jgi:lysozyme family protein
MANFDIAHKLTSLSEGGYSNRKNDRGGETYAGISRKYWPTWPGWKVVDLKKRKYKEHIPELDSLVHRFYRAEFWNNVNGDKITSQKVANSIYDWFVTSEKAAIKRIQRILKLVEDGDIGPKTIAAINASNETKLLADIRESRRGFYMAIVSNDASQQENLNGWLKRADKFA